MVCPTLELRDLACVRGGRALFSGLSLGLHAGRMLRVRGANGAGKTSLLRLVCGLLRPTQGEVLWQGTRIDAMREGFHRQLIYIGHAAALKDDLTAGENLQSAARLAGWPTSRRAVSAALAEVGLPGCDATPARGLSQGQRRRVALARLVLGAQAPLWVLDEPFDALDATAAAWLVRCTASQVRRGGTVLLTSHDPALAFPADMPQMELVL
ncbi:cytochrome c biogenesis heme-transporting ATPase CcmA [Variovorax sp. KK3]|uniref:cytochrome c biogenesis heme-transporting ATPase CcmA n=1 Tax=Variovorax sp. KK3 TaxID=1855728 RepID=UPI00097C0ED2|nr:cytochrome c biogenesis heme-transporting ATPase CcmA [Variovorax sp. KK3]